MALRLAGKVALITGAASGIGRATARLFAREGARLLVSDVNSTGLEETTATIGDAAVPLRMDVSSEDDWIAATRKAAYTLGKLDIVANIAGIGFPGSIEDVRLEEFEKMVAVNLTGVMLGCKHGVRTISASGGTGAIVNVSSIGGLVGAADIAGYCATKGGVTTLTKSVALHCAAQGLPIRCVSVHPTYVDSEMLDPIAEQFDNREQMLAGMAREVPIGRVATPEDVARTIVFAASDDAAMISGSALLVDGAQLAGPPSSHSPQ